jgi:hypothetical protein
MAKLRIFHVPMSSLAFKSPVEVPEDQSGHHILRIVQKNHTADGLSSCRTGKLLSYDRFHQLAGAKQLA